MVRVTPKVLKNVIFKKKTGFENVNFCCCCCLQLGGGDARLALLLLTEPAGHKLIALGHGGRAGDGRLGIGRRYVNGSIDIG